MNRNQREQNRRTARVLADVVFEMNLPDGLRMRGRQFRYTCPSCEQDREWYGEKKDVVDFDQYMPCGGSERCIP